MAFLVALNIVLSRLLSMRISIGGVEGIRIGLGGLPIILAGIGLGPWQGGIVGAVADIIGYMINPMGAYAPHFTLSAFLTGFIPGAVTRYIFNNQNRLWHLVVAVLMGELVTNVLLVPYFLNSLFGLPIKATIIPQIASVLIQTPFYAYLISLMLQFRVLEPSSAAVGRKR
jgi:ECF transporter S component (folate family)